MMAALWSDVDADMGFAARHFGQAVSLFRSERFTGPGGPGYFDEMAFLHAMQSGYMSFEAGLKRILALIDEDLPKGGDSHADLLRRVSRPVAGARPAILDEPLYRVTDELRRFRHVATHTYNYLDLQRAASAVTAAEVFLARLEPALAAFRAAIDPD